MYNVVQVALALGIAFWSVPCTVEAQQDSLVAYSAPSEVILHQPVVVKVELRTHLDTNVVFDLGFDRLSGFAVRVRQPDGEPRNPRIKESGVARITLTPGERRIHTLLLNEWMDFDQVGMYDLEIALSRPVVTAKGTVVNSLPVQFRFVVAPADPATLQRVCQQLADAVINQNLIAEDRLNAARALSHVMDSAALPSWKTILIATDLMDSIAVEGLLRIGGAEARAFFAEMSQSDRSERASLGRNALQRLNRRSR